MPKGFCGCFRGEGRTLLPRPACRLFGVLLSCLLVSLAFSSWSHAQTTRSEESRFSRSAEAEITFQEGVLQYTRKQLPEAEENFRKVIKADPNDAEAYYYLGLAQLDQHKTTDAIASFDESLRLDPTRQEVRAARATANIRAQNFAAAKADVDKLAPDPRWNSLVHYLRGQILFNQGDLEGAKSEFAAAKAAGGTEAEPAGFYEGLTYMKLRQNVQARAAFQETTIDPENDPTAANAARQLEAALAAQEGVPSRRWSAGLTLSYVYDSNVVQLNGAAAGLPSNQGDSRIVVQPYGSYSFIRNDKLDVAIQASGYFAFQFEQNEFDIASYQIGPVATYRLAQNVTAGLQYTYNYIEYGHDPYLSRNIVTPSLTITEPKVGYTQVYYQFEARQFNESFTHQYPTASSFDVKDALDRDGQNHTLGITQSIAMPEIFQGAGPTSLEVAYRLTDQETVGSDYDAMMNSIGLTFYTPLPFWKLRADAGVVYEVDNYRHPNSLDTTDHHQRFDQIVNATVGVTREISKGLSVRVDYTYTNSNSNVDFEGSDIYTYDRSQVGVRLIYAF